MKKSLRRLIIVHPHLSFLGGAEILLVHFTAGLLKLGIEVKLVTLSLTEECRSRFDPRLIFVLPKRGLSYGIRSKSVFSALGFIGEINELRRLVRKELSWAEVVNAHNFPSTWCLDKRAGRPVVWMCNETPDLWNNPNPSFLLKVLYRLGSYMDRQRVRANIDRSVVSDQVNAQRFLSRYNRPPEIVNYGVDYDFFSQPITTALRKEYGLTNAIVILQVGLFSPQKNQLQSVEALNKISRVYPEARLLFAGEGKNDYEERVKNAVRGYSLQDRVFFLGHVNRERVRELYRLADIALFPTLGQGGWLSPFEAMAAGVPVVVNPELSASYIIKENNLGYVSQDYAKAIAEIIANPEASGKMAERAKGWVRDNLSWSGYTKKMVDIFNALI